MRTKNKIEEDIRMGMKDLNLLVEKSLEDEQNFEKRRKDIENHIKTLKVEKPHEKTLVGQTEALVADTKEKIEVLLDELAQTTGIELQLHFGDKSKTSSGFVSVDTEKFLMQSSKRHIFAFPHKKVAFKIAVEAVLMDPYNTGEMRVDKISILIDEML